MKIDDACSRERRATPRSRSWNNSLPRGVVGKGGLFAGHPIQDASLPGKRKCVGQFHHIGKGVEGRRPEIGIDHAGCGRTVGPGFVLNLENDVVKAACFARELADIPFLKPENVARFREYGLCATRAEQRRRGPSEGKFSSVVGSLVRKNFSALAWPYSFPRLSSYSPIPENTDCRGYPATRSMRLVCAGVESQSISVPACRVFPRRESRPGGGFRARGAGRW